MWCYSKATSLERKPVDPSPLAVHFISVNALKPIFYYFHLKSSNFCSTNISVGDEEERVLFSGMHTVADIFCCCCGQNVGWKYVSIYIIFCF